jgi:hypothetical protein
MEGRKEGFPQGRVIEARKETRTTVEEAQRKSGSDEAGGGGGAVYFRTDILREQQQNKPTYFRRLFACWLGLQIF